MAPLRILSLSLLMAGSLSALPIEILDSTFGRVGGGEVSNTYTGTNHVALEYLPENDFLEGDYRFSVSFEFTSTGDKPGGGVAVWFGPANSAEWAFVNEEFGTAHDQLRFFTARNLTNNTNAAGNTITTASILDNRFYPDAPFTLTVERRASGAGYTLDMWVTNDTTEQQIAIIENVSSKLATTWGISIYAVPQNETISSLTTTTVTALDVTAIPEPSLVWVLLGGAGALLLPRRSIRR